MMFIMQIDYVVLLSVLILVGLMDDRETKDNLEFRLRKCHPVKFEVTKGRYESFGRRNPS